MSEIESDLSALVAKVSQLEKQQVTLKKYVVKLKHTLDEQIENFYHRPEIQYIENLQENLPALNLRLDELFALSNPITSTAETQDISPDNFSSNTEVDRNQLVFDRDGSRGVLIEALETVKERLILVCPWLNCNSIDEYLLQKFKDCLNRNCQIDIGWGYLGDRSNIGKGWKYNALADLQDLEESYPGLFRLKLLGTHENFLVCDANFAFLGSHNFLASGNQSLEREVGIMTTDSDIIQGLADRFDDGESLDEEEINQRFAASVKSLDEPEYLSGVMDMNEAECSEIWLEVDEDEEEEEESRQPIVSAEEFLRRYNEGERDFTGINLSGVDLSGKSFAADLNLSNANFNGANLSGTSFNSVDLTGAKFRDVNLRESNLNSAKLSEARFINTNLNKAQMNYAKLEKANFRNANLSEANLESANLTQVMFRNVNLSQAKLGSANFTEANLNGVNFSNTELWLNPNFSGANLRKANLRGLNLRNANLTNADLSQADLSRFNLLEVNLKGANLKMVKMKEALYNETTIFPQGFNPAKLGAYLIAPGASLSGVNLAGYNLINVNLRGSNLEGANLNSTNLNNSDLSDANLVRFV
ncbi:MAG: pentapeptide repeat-containing protein [Microcoleaceae cyanobacterium]